MLRQHVGFTMLELLIIIAIIGIVGSIGVANSRNFLRAEQTRGAATTLQEMFRQGSTSSSARYKPVLLTQENKNGVRSLVLKEQGASREIRRETIPQVVTTNLPTGTIVTFMPSGRIDTVSFAALPQTISVTSQKLKINFAVTLIGDSKITAVTQ